MLGEAEVLLRDGWTVDALETPESIARRSDLYAAFSARPAARVISSIEQARRSYRLICVTHVLEFIEDPPSRLEALRELRTRLSPRGHLLLSLRGWSDVLAASKAYPRGDGIITGIGTFTRGFSLEEAFELLEATGLKVVDSPHGPRAKKPEQVRLVCQAV